MDTAVFLGSGGVVTLGAPITAGGLRFRTTGYSLTGSTLALTGSGAITAELGTVATIASLLNGTNGLTLAGTGSSGRGAVRLTNSLNSYTGTTTISGGNLVITNDGQLGNSSNAVAINGVQTAGLAGGSLLLAGSTAAAGYTTGLTLAATRSMTMTGGAVGYANAVPATSGSALISVGNNTISGQLTTLPIAPGFATGAVSGFGVLTLSNLSAGGTAVTNFTTFGSNSSIGGYHLNGTLTGTGSINKAGGGTLILAPAVATGFAGTVRVTAGSVRVADPLALGTNVGTGLNSAFDLNGGVFEIRADTFDASTRGLASRATSTLFVDHAIGSSAINGNATFGNFIGNANTVATFNSRNGFNTTLNAGTITPASTSVFTLGIINSGNGRVTFTGNVWGLTSSTAHTLTVTATGDIQVNTGIAANPANTTNQFTKAGTGTLTIAGVASTIVSPTSINAGTLAITDFRSLTLASTQNINIGASTVAGALTIGTTTASTAAGLTAAASRVVNLAGTTGGATINANQTFAAPVILTSPFAATGVGLKTLTLGGTSTGGSDATPNTINGAIGNAATGFAQTANSASGATVLTFASTTGIVVGQHVAGTGIPAGTTVTGVTATTVTLSRGTSAARTTQSLDVSNGGGAAISLTKADAGTWQLAGVNTYTGATTITNSTLKLKANAAASTIVADASAITFNANATTLTAGGTLEFIGISGSATTETLGALTPTAGAGKVTLTSGGAGAAANLTFSSLGATTAASSVNFSTTDGGGGVVTLTGQAETTATTLPGSANFLGHLYVNGADFAAINASAQVITPTYGTTPGFVNGGAALTAGSHNNKGCSQVSERDLGLHPLLFVRMGLLRVGVATVSVLCATSIFLAGGILGTFHHRYFAGTPMSIIAIGASFSALEVVPLVLIGFEGWHNYKLSQAKEWVLNYKWPIWCMLAVAFWNMLGAGIFGFLINPPIALYYMQGLNTTPLHGHTALFGVYGMLGIGLMLFVGKGLAAPGRWKQKLISFSFWSINLGLLLMALLSLLPVGLMQTVASVNHGFWYARSDEFLGTGLMDTFKWLRVVGDSLFAVGTLTLGWFVLGLKFGWSLIPDDDPRQDG